MGDGPYIFWYDRAKFTKVPPIGPNSITQKFRKILESLCFDIVYKGFWHFFITNLGHSIRGVRSGTIETLKNGLPIKLEFWWL